MSDIPHLEHLEHLEIRPSRVNLLNTAHPWWMFHGVSEEGIKGKCTLSVPSIPQVSDGIKHIMYYQRVNPCYPPCTWGAGGIYTAGVRGFRWASGYTTVKNGNWPQPAANWLPTQLPTVPPFRLCKLHSICPFSNHSRHCWDYFCSVAFRRCQ